MNISFRPQAKTPAPETKDVVLNREVIGIVSSLSHYGTDAGYYVQLKIINDVRAPGAGLADGCGASQEEAVENALKEAAVKAARYTLALARLTEEILGEEKP